MLDLLSDPAHTETICALSSPSGTGAVALIRISGLEALKISWKHFQPVNKALVPHQLESHTQYFGKWVVHEQETDDILFCYFKAPKSYTSEDVVEISCHGSVYIQQVILESLLESGCRMARPGEFTLRAYLNGRFDLSQAEAVADLIASQSRTAHQLAMSQMRGGFSDKIKALRQQLVDFASLIALELDFSEEDVEFANRDQFMQLIEQLRAELDQLIDSFKMGNVLKRGIPVAIIGQPNVGKSTLLNAILNEERALVSDIPGTTRDTVEDTIVVDGFMFRFIDTAGLRNTGDAVESMGIERTYEKIAQAHIILYTCDISYCTPEHIGEVLKEFNQYLETDDKHFILVANKIDELDESPARMKELFELETVFVSAKRKENINLLMESLVEKVRGMEQSTDTIVSNTRHLDALTKALDALLQVENGFNSGIPTDLITIDLRQCLHYLGEITGEITTDELLGNIFSKFCIGK